MNKKILSFVLATVLTVGLGAGSILMATNYVESVSMSDMNLYNPTAGDKGVALDSSYAGVVASDMSNKVCAVFNYKAGSVLSVVDQDNNITLYSNGSPLLTLGYNYDQVSGKGTYSVTGINISGANLAAITGGSGSVTKENLTAFLKKMGVTDQMLSYTDDNANGTQKTVAWLDKAVAALNAGVNHSISINFTSAKGASVTLSENGKQLETLSYDGIQIAKFNYNTEGFLTSVDQTTFEAEVDTEKTSTDQQKDGANVTGAKWKENHTTTYYNAYGQATHVKNSDGAALTTYTYSSNGSMVSSYDATTKSTTYYSGGKPSFVTNAEGSMTARYDYLPNGSLNGITSFGKAGTPTSITAYLFGKSIGSADLSAGTGVQNYADLRAAIKDFKTNPSAAIADLKAKCSATDTSNTSRFSNITSISLYKEDLGNSALLSTIGISKGAADQMRAWGNGNSSVSEVSLTIDTIPFETETTNESKTVVKGGSFPAYTETSENVTQEGKEGVKLSFKFTVNDRGAAVAQYNGAECTLRAAVPKKVTVTTTTTKDPAVVGTCTQVVEIDGKTYAVVQNANIDLLDGNGFQAADGEDFYIEIDETTANLLREDMEKNGGSVTFAAAGYIGEDVNGCKTITSVYAHSTYLDSNIDAAVSEFSKELENNEKAQENKAINMELFKGFTGTGWQAGWDFLKNISEDEYNQARIAANF